MFLRRLRGIASTALLWGTAWAFIAGSVAATSVLVLGAYLGPFRAFGQGALTGLSWGVAAGALFGSALMLAEQRRGFGGLTLARAATWGTVAGVWFPLLIGLAFGQGSLPLMVVGWPAYLVTGTMGALSGLATLWLARRSPSPHQNADEGDSPDQDRLPSPAGSPAWGEFREARPARGQ